MGDKGARWLAEARRRHGAGDAAGALALYRRCLERGPARPEVLAAAAMAAAQTGRLEEAEGWARRAVALAPGGRAWVLLGRVLMQRGDAAGAAEWFLRATEDASLAPDAWFHLGQARRLAGDLAAAREALGEAIGLRPNHGPAQNELGVVLAAQRRPGQAVEHFAASLAARPGHEPVLANLLRALTDAGRLEEAARLAERERDREADPAWRLALARLERARGRLPEARAAFEGATRASPEDPAAWAGLGATLQALGEMESAGEAYRRALELEPGHPEALAGRAERLEWLGRYEEGLDSLPAEDAEGSPSVDLVRARLLRRLGRLDEAAGALDRAAEKAGDDALLGRQIAFTLGDVEDARGRYDEAFAAYARGNRLAGGDYDPEAHGRWLERLAGLAPPPGRGDAGTGVVFVLGMPRSGTTLVEQVLAAHPAVTAGGERPHLGRLVHAAAARAEGPLSPTELETLAGDYLGGLPARPAPGAVVSDKMPLNFLYLGLIRAALPGARIVHCRRDPRDTALSCYFTDFIDPNLAFSRRLEWAADYLRRYLALMEGHRGAPGMMELAYEDLVAEPEGRVRALLEFCGLDWHPGCLDFHASGRYAATASHAQVREPVYTRSVGRWRHYRDHIGPLLAAFPPEDGAA